MSLASRKRQIVFDLLQFGGQVDENVCLTFAVRHATSVEFLIDSLLEEIFALCVACYLHHLTTQQNGQSKANMRGGPKSD